MNKESLGKVLSEIESLRDEDQVMLIRQIRTVLGPRAQSELTDRSGKGL